MVERSGNVLADGTNTYAWNAESEIKTAAGVNYTYDGDGNRVQKSNGKIYWYGAGSEILDESDASGNFTDEYVYFGGKRIAHRVVSGNSIYYYAEDFLGTSRVMTTSTGTVCYDADFYPFGGERIVTNTCAQNYKFEGKERDAETNNDDFGARYYSSQFGRWTSPDWSAIPTPVPYANLTNPQTLNLYAMVSDNPETFADLDGHECCDGDSVADFVFGTVNALGNDFAGTQRIQGNSDTTSGQKLGDAISVVVGTVGALAAAITDVVADVGSGGLAVVAAPAQAAAVAIPANGALEGAKNLFFSNRVGDFSSGDKKQMDQDNANKNGGQNKCTQCGQDVQKAQNKQGEPAPGNQLQRHHDPPCRREETVSPRKTESFARTAILKSTSNRRIEADDESFSRRFIC